MADKVCQPLTRQNIRQFMDSYDNFMTDCGGVLWHDDLLVDGAVDTVKLLRRMDKKVYYVSNNSTRTRGEYVTRCHRMGFPAEETDMVGAGYATALYIRNKLRLPADKKVYMIGTDGLSEELSNMGITNIGNGADPGPDLFGRNIKLDPKVRCVVVAIDPHFSFSKLSTALSYLSDPTMPFLITNVDVGRPKASGMWVAGTDSISAAVEVGAHRKADIVCGKPNQPLLDIMVDEYKCDLTRTVLLGDRLSTDIRFAGKFGMTSVLMMSGLTSHAQLEALEESVRRGEDPPSFLPKYYCHGIRELGDLVREELGDFQ